MHYIVVLFTTFYLAVLTASSCTILLPPDGRREVESLTQIRQREDACIKSRGQESSNLKTNDESIQQLESWLRAFNGKKCCIKLEHFVNNLKKGIDSQQVLKKDATQALPEILNIPPKNIAIEQQKKVIEVLLMHGADLNGQLDPMLHHVIEQGNVALLRWLIESYHPSVNVGLVTKGSPLEYALKQYAENESQELASMVDILIEHCASPCAFSGYLGTGVSPLYFALTKGYQVWVLAMLDKIQKIGACPSYLNPPIHIAINKGYVNVVQKLIQKGADCSQLRKGDGPLHLALRIGNMDMIKLLLDQIHDDINLKFNYGTGDTPLAYAIVNQNFEAAYLLLEHPKIDLNKRFGDHTPLDLCVLYGWGEDHSVWKKYLRLIYLIRQKGGRFAKCGGLFQNGERFSSSSTGTPRAVLSKEVERSFEALELPPTATAQEVKRAYHKLVREYHPDKHTGASEEKIRACNEKMQKLNQAVAVLSNYFRGE